MALPAPYLHVRVPGRCRSGWLRVCKGSGMCVNGSRKSSRGDQPAKIKIMRALRGGYILPGENHQQLKHTLARLKRQDLGLQNSIQHTYLEESWTS